MQMRYAVAELVFLALPSTSSAFWRARDRDAPSWCPHLAPTPGPSSRRDTLEFCDALVKAHRRGLSNESIVVDVGTDRGTEALTARGFGHPVITFECRGREAVELGGRPSFWNDTGVRLVHACVGEKAGLATLLRAADSSSMNARNVEVDGAAWKRRREVRRGAASEPVPVVRLDDALDAGSLQALGWAHLGGGGRVGFVKIDVQGLEGSVLRGMVATLMAHRPFVYYEDSMLPPAERGGSLLQRLVRKQQLSGGRRVDYECRCRNDCFCTPEWR